MAHANIDEVAIALIGWHPARRGVGLLEEALFGQVGHDVADGGRGNTEVQYFGKGAGTHRLGGFNVALDDHAKNLVESIFQAGRWLFQALIVSGHGSLSDLGNCSPQFKRGLTICPATDSMIASRTGSGGNLNVHLHLCRFCNGGSSVNVSTHLSRVLIKNNGLASFRQEKTGPRMGGGKSAGGKSRRSLEPGAPESPGRRPMPEAPWPPTFSGTGLPDGTPGRAFLAGILGGFC